MIRWIAGSFLLFVLAGGTAQAHTGKPRYHVVIDTDGAIDDLRAISMLLAGNDIRVLAVTCSKGTLPPVEVYDKVTALLTTYHHEGIPVGLGVKSDMALPEWAGFAEDVNWGEVPGTSLGTPPKTAVDVLHDALYEYPDKVVLIALGSLRTYADWIGSERGVTGKIERIIWYNDHELEKGFNYQVSPESYERIIAGGIPLEIVAEGEAALVINRDYMDQVRHSATIYGEAIAAVHSREPALTRVNTGHLLLWDDLVPLYLTVPLLFNSEMEHNIRYVTPDPQLPASFIYESIGKLLGSSAGSNDRVFLEFPSDSTLFKPLYSGMVAETVRKYGMQEWKAVCMTNEIHGHTGIYSIIGAKMGIRALEYFNVGVNNVVVTTYAGSEPPLSCFNDGIQISTGATIGQGLITIADTIAQVPAADFVFNNRKVRMALKPVMSNRMKEDIRYGIATYGLQTDQYWLYIEALAIQYWTGLDRHEIFNISIVP